MWSNLRKLLLGLVADSGLPFAVVVALISLQVAAAPPTSAAPVPTAPPSATVPGACQPVGDLHFICRRHRRGGFSPCWGWPLAGRRLFAALAYKRALGWRHGRPVPDRHDLQDRPASRVVRGRQARRTLCELHSSRSHCPQHAWVGLSLLAPVT